MQSQSPFDYNDRYGIKKGQNWVGFAVLIAIAGIGWLTWAGLHHSNPPIRVQLISFTVNSDRETSIRYSVDRDGVEGPVVCTLIARDYYKNIVGQLDEEIPAGQGKIEQRTSVATRIEAVNADVLGCRPK
ncbi:MAG: DUF4307 domain-containing protein [Actinobacteria bacterium]|jgi:hypothetical protein|uniref:Unannotated protein n=1 Tax=freshwater metagenome TaxID=449393 RepID=A0A6J6E7P8_9ZZZZ|nr:DUF4307 domain-containing protein [Actinomycetota bacterium]